MDSMSAAASRGGDASGLAVSQLNDYLHRGAHPLARDMRLYIYSMWVYRSENAPFPEGYRFLTFVLFRPVYVSLSRSLYASP